MRAVRRSVAASGSVRICGINELMKLSYALIAGALLWFVWTYRLGGDGLHRFLVDA
jgi:hypothetical protein